MKRGWSRDASARDTSQRLTPLSSLDAPLLIATAAMPAVLLAAHLPSRLLLPAISVFAFTTAASAATAGWLTNTPRNVASVTIWDFAGACLLIGIAASVLSGSASVSHLFGIANASP